MAPPSTALGVMINPEVVAWPYVVEALVTLGGVGDSAYFDGQRVRHRAASSIRSFDHELRCFQTYQEIDQCPAER